MRNIKKEWRTPIATMNGVPLDRLFRHTNNNTWFRYMNGGKLIKSTFCLEQQVNMEEKLNWATPNTMDHMALRSDEALVRLATGFRVGCERPSNLREQIDERSCEIYKLVKRGDVDLSMNGAINENSDVFPTIMSRDYKEGNDPRPHGLGQVSPPQKVGRGRLNPRWVECLMGIPVGWVNPTCDVLYPTESTNSEDCDIYQNLYNNESEIRLLGNGVVPNTAAKAFCVLLKELNGEE